MEFESITILIAIWALHAWRLPSNMNCAFGSLAFLLFWDSAFSPFSEAFEKRRLKYTSIPSVVNLCCVLKDWGFPPIFLSFPITTFCLPRSPVGDFRASYWFSVAGFLPDYPLSIPQFQSFTLSICDSCLRNDSPPFAVDNTPGRQPLALSLFASLTKSMRFVSSLML